MQTRTGQGRPGHADARFPVPWPAPPVAPDTPAAPSRSNPQSKTVRRRAGKSRGEHGVGRRHMTASRGRARVWKRDGRRPAHESPPAPLFRRPIAQRVSGQGRACQSQSGSSRDDDSRVRRQRLAAL